MKFLGSASDPSSFIAYQLAHGGRKPPGRGPRPGCGLGCLPLLIGAIIGVGIAMLH